MIVTLSKRRIMFDFGPEPMNIHRVPPPLGEKFLSNRGVIRECAILDIINRMREHVSDNPMILNSPRSLFGG